MTRKPTPRRRIKPTQIPNLVKSLTVLDTDVSKLEERLSKARLFSAPGDVAVCIIDVECCIINCKRDVRPDLQIAVNPGDVLEGFAFKLSEQVNNPEAPVYCIAETDARAAFRMGHESVRVPGGAIDARIVGVAGELFASGTLRKQKIAPTASVIALSPGKALAGKAAGR